MSDPKVIFKADCAGKSFSIMRYMYDGKRSYIVSEDGRNVFYRTVSIKDAMNTVAERMHLVFALSEADDAVASNDK